MIGLDTSFLVAWAIPEHADHAACRTLALHTAGRGRRFGLTAGILAEFIHVATDSRRFQNPLTMDQAGAISAFWAQASEVTLLVQDDRVIQQWHTWLTQHRLGRKRLLDTLIAATWHIAGITDVFTLNPADFTVFGVFTTWPQDTSML